jgi:hypothetical protein
VKWDREKVASYSIAGEFSLRFGRITAERRAFARSEQLDEVVSREIRIPNNGA